MVLAGLVVLTVIIPRFRLLLNRVEEEAWRPTVPQLELKAEDWRLASPQETIDCGNLDPDGMKTLVWHEASHALAVEASRHRRIQSIKFVAHPNGLYAGLVLDRDRHPSRSQINRLTLGRLWPNLIVATKWESTAAALAGWAGETLTNQTLFFTDPMRFFEEIFNDLNRTAWAVAIIVNRLERQKGLDTTTESLLKTCPWDAADELAKFNESHPRLRGLVLEALGNRQMDQLTTDAYYVAFVHAYLILEAHRPELQRLQEALMSRSRMDRREIMKIIKTAAAS